MTISMSSFARTVAYMTTENAIANEEVNRDIIAASHTEAIGEIAASTAQKEQANNLRSAMSYVNMASSAVNVVKSGQNIGESIDTMQQQQAAQPQLEHGVDAARHGEGMDDLKAVRLGENGPRVGDRFNDEQLGVLTREGPVTETKEELTRMGFSEREADSLRSAGRDGLSRDESVSFMWDHRQTQQQQDASHVKQKTMEGIQSQTVALFGQAMQQEAKASGKEASRSSELSKMLDEVSSKAADATIDHGKKLDEIDVKAIEQAAGNTQKKNAN